EKVLRPRLTAQIGHQPEHRLAVAPCARTNGVAGGDEEGAPVAADPARRPDAATPPASAPADHVPRVPQAEADHRAMVIAAIAVMPAVRDIDPAAQNGERAALVLKPGIKMFSAGGQSLGDFDRPARQWRAVRERQG